MTSPDAIPKDVMAVALDLVGCCPISMGLMDIYKLRDAIARAIMDERERCAKIAENYGSGDYWGKATPIADAIRTPVHSEPSK
jgi:hypothetical protein